MATCRLCAVHMASRTLGHPQWVGLFFLHVSKVTFSYPNTRILLYSNPYSTHFVKTTNEVNRHGVNELPPLYVTSRLCTPSVAMLADAVDPRASVLIHEC